jgi:hypothetical protein
MELRKSIPGESPINIGGERFAFMNHHLTALLSCVRLPEILRDLGETPIGEDRPGWPLKITLRPRVVKLSLTRFPRRPS